MRKNNQTQKIGDLISKTLFNDSFKQDKLQQVMKHSTIFSFWPTIVGTKFASVSKPLQIKAGKLYVTVKSPVVAQELSLYKRKLIVKVNSYSKPLGLEINDIIFNYRNYCATVPETLKSVEDKPVFLNDEELNNTEVDLTVKQQITEHISKINMLNEEQKARLIKKAIDNQKAIKLRKNI